MLPGYDKQHTTDTQVSQQNIHPDIRREGVEEGEDPRVGPVGLAVQYTYTQRHEGLGEVDNLLAHICDGEGSHCQISSLSRANIKGKRDVSHGHRKHLEAIKLRKQGLYTLLNLSQGT